MNSPITFPSPEPALKLSRPSPDKWAATLAEERRRLQEDHEALREREQNLRDYESRLRVLQSEIEAGRAAPAVTTPAPTRNTAPAFARLTSRTPFAEDTVLQTGWEKLHRARELLEAEERNLRDTRISLHEQEQQVKRREEAVAEREARAAERESLLLDANAPAEPIAGEHTMSAVTMFTRSPFNVARSMLLGKKS